MAAAVAAACALAVAVAEAEGAWSATNNDTKLTMFLMNGTTSRWVLQAKSNREVDFAGDVDIAGNLTVDDDVNIKISDSEQISSVINTVINTISIELQKETIYARLTELGYSENVINAAKKCKEMNIKVVTFTGFDSENKLKQLGDLNFWLDSKAYNIVEMTHQIWLLGVVDAIIGTAEYSAS